MLDIMKRESINEFIINGVLNEIDVKEGTSPKTNDGWISCEAAIRVDQEINGKVEENIIPIKLFSNRHKKDSSGKPSNELNVNYDRIKEYGEKLIALGSVEPGEEGKASRVSVTASIRENSFAGRDGRIVNTWQLSTNFINSMKNSDDEEATFLVTGVVVKKIHETDREGEETGRLIVKLCIVGWNGSANVIDFIAEGSAADHIDRNWEQGDTIKAAGVIAMTKKTVKTTEDVGFGEPIVHTRTETRRELIIKSGSGAGLSEDESYDSDDIKVALDKRKAYLTSLENAPKATSVAKKNDGFGF
jgi:hypothetical protein